MSLGKPEYVQLERSFISNVGIGSKLNHLCLVLADLMFLIVFNFTGGVKYFLKSFEPFFFEVNMDVIIGPLGVSGENFPLILLEADNSILWILGGKFVPRD